MNPSTTHRSLRAFCIGCGYSLRGLRDDRCPECGRAFDLRDATTFRLESLQQPHWVLLAAVWGVMQAAILFHAWFWFRIGLLPYLIPLLLWCIVPYPLLGVFAWQQRMSRSALWMVLAGIAVSLALAYPAVWIALHGRGPWDAMWYAGATVAAYVIWLTVDRVASG